MKYEIYINGTHYDTADSLASALGSVNGLGDWVDEVEIKLGRDVVFVFPGQLRRSLDSCIPVHK